MPGLPLQAHMHHWAWLPATDVAAEQQITVPIGPPLPPHPCPQTCRPMPMRCVRCLLRARRCPAAAATPATCTRIWPPSTSVQVGWGLGGKGWTCRWTTHTGWVGRQEGNLRSTRLPAT